MARITPEYLDKLEAIHREVDGVAASLGEKLGDRLVCKRGCSDCCRDDLTVFEIEAVLIADRCGEFLVAAEPAAAGGCAFLDGNGACRIYPWRPYVCRTQGLPLRWLEEAESNVERRDICPLNDAVMIERGEDLTTIPEEYCWTIGPWEGRLAGLQAEASGSFKPTRVALRSLFLKS